MPQAKERRKSLTSNEILPLLQSLCLQFLLLRLALGFEEVHLRLLDIGVEITLLISCTQADGEDGCEEGKDECGCHSWVGDSGDGKFGYGREVGGLIN